MISPCIKRICFLVTLTVFMFAGQVRPQNISGKKISEAALSLTKDRVVYDPSYFSIEYPNGDVPSNRGVCTDVVIRTFRKCGIDLQRLVHEDMKNHFGLYPKNWGLGRPDPNIDHRRVPNLRTFFSRYWNDLQITEKGSDYLAGDIVTWSLGGGVTHIGMVASTKTEDGTRPFIVHNIGAGQVLEDCLFNFEVTGHYRFP